MNALDIFDEMQPNQAPPRPSRKDALKAIRAAATFPPLDIAAHENPKTPDKAVLVQGSTLKPVPVAWLWKCWLALKKLHILAGMPGQGKTTIAIALAATITIGGRWPDGTRCEVGNVTF